MLFERSENEGENILIKMLLNCITAISDKVGVEMQVNFLKTRS
jgi:hypothetical protein